MKKCRVEISSKVMDYGSTSKVYNIQYPSVLIHAKGPKRDIIQKEIFTKVQDRFFPKLNRIVSYRANNIYHNVYIERKYKINQQDRMSVKNKFFLKVLNNIEDYLDPLYDGHISLSIIIDELLRYDFKDDKNKYYYLNIIEAMKKLNSSIAKIYKIKSEFIAYDGWVPSNFGQDPDTEDLILLDIFFISQCKLKKIKKPIDKKKV